MDNINEPVKPAIESTALYYCGPNGEAIPFGDAEIEATIREYLASKLEKVQARVKTYCKIEAGFIRIAPELPTRFEFSIYTEASGVTLAPRAGLAVEFTLAALCDVRVAKKLRDEAAERITRAEQIEAAAMEGGAK